MKLWRQILPAVLGSWGTFIAVFWLHSACVTKNSDKTGEKGSKGKSKSAETGSDSSSSSSASAPKAELNLSPEERQKIEEYKAEIEIGRNMAGRLLAFYGTNADDKLRGYVNQVGNYVASYGDYPERRYMFAILENESVNAFACPGGYILVTMGTIRAAQTEAELGMILGHEAAHVGKQHMFNTLKAMDKESAEKAAKEGDKATEIPESVKIRKRPDPVVVEELSKFAKLVSTSSVAGLGILQAAKAGMGLMLEKGLDQKLEFEADQEGVKYAIRAGYDPKAMLNFLDRLAEKKKLLNVKTLEKTHPKLEDRESRIKELLVAMKAEEIVGASGTARFNKIHGLLPEVRK